MVRRRIFNSSRFWKLRRVPEGSKEATIWVIPPSGPLDYNALTNSIRLDGGDIREKKRKDLARSELLFRAPTPTLLDISARRWVISCSYALRTNPAPLCKSVRPRRVRATWTFFNKVICCVTKGPFSLSFCLPHPLCVSRSNNIKTSLRHWWIDDLGGEKGSQSNWIGFPLFSPSLFSLLRLRFRLNAFTTSRQSFFTFSQLSTLMCRRENNQTAVVCFFGAVFLNC